MKNKLLSAAFAALAIVGGVAALPSPSQAQMTAAPTPPRIAEAPVGIIYYIDVMPNGQCLFHRVNDNLSPVHSGEFYNEVVPSFAPYPMGSAVGLYDGDKAGNTMAWWSGDHPGQGQNIAGLFTESEFTVKVHITLRPTAGAPKGTVPYDVNIVRTVAIPPQCRKATTTAPPAPTTTAFNVPAVTVGVDVLCGEGKFVLSLPNPNPSFVASFVVYKTAGGQILADNIQALPGGGNSYSEALGSSAVTRVVDWRWYTAQGLRLTSNSGPDGSQTVTVPGCAPATTAPPTVVTAPVVQVVIVREPAPVTAAAPVAAVTTTITTTTLAPTTTVPVQSAVTVAVAPAPSQLPAKAVVAQPFYTG